MKRIKIITLSVLALLPILIFYLQILIFAVNVPQADDYDTILWSTDRFLESKDLNTKIEILFSQFYEHRAVFLRAATLLAYYLTDKIDFRFLIFLGNISLLGLSVVLLLSFAPADSKNKPLYFIPAIFFLFHPQYFDTIYLASNALTHLYVLFFSFLSLYLLTKESIKYFLFSLLAAIIAIFTLGNGILVFFVGLVPLLYKRRYREIILWILTGAGCSVLYFNGYMHPPNQLAISTVVFKPLIHTINNFSSFTGMSFLEFGDNFARCSGIVCFLYFIYLIKIKYYKKNITIFSFLTFLFLTAMTVALFRRAGGLPWRYKAFSIHFLVLSYLSLIEILPEKSVKRIFPVLLILSIFFNLFSYSKNYNYLVMRKKSLIVRLFYLKDRNIFGFDHSDRDRANSIISSAIAKKLYFLPHVSSLADAD
ncbi:MAG: hypothetical protein V1884_03975 [Candidatus Omnitrophota bacterium]